MFPRRRNGNACGHLLCLTVCFIFQFRAKDNVLSYVSMWSPTSSDFKTNRLTAEEKEKFLDEHNKFRGMVKPTSADMEFMEWDDNLANMAQMWADKCIWEHGFLTFGSQYPYSVPFKGQIGQNLAQEYGRLSSPEDRVKRWYEEYQYYTFSKYTSPMGASCKKTPCGHYTQIMWAKAIYLGCGVNFCSNFNGGNGGTIVVCNYNTGNIVGQYPYKTGTPCTKCASGKGWCYNNLCRNCSDFDKHCGSSLTTTMCSSHPELMEKNCPKLCNMCKCPLKCQNGGTVNKQDCVCSCPSGWRGMDCSDKACEPGFYGENCENRCYDKVGTETCQYRLKVGHKCSSKYMEIDCALTCGYCVLAGGQNQITATAASVTALPTTPQPGSVTSHPVVSATTPSSVTVPPTSKPQVCTTDQNSGCERWAAVGECEKNPLWMITNCFISCKHHQAPKDCSDANPSCPRWAYAGECENNRVWMLKNCRKSCNQCGDCTDSDPKCPSWALSNQCSSGDKLNEKCRRSCGLCRVYDKHKECPAWSAMDECKKSNWTWMVDHCPRSCDVPFSEASFCGGKENGNYQAPTTCQAYIACSYGVTSHVQCPFGKKFDTLQRMCVLVDQAACTVVLPSKKSKPFMIVTL